MVEKERRTNQDRREDVKQGVSHDLNYNKPEHRNIPSDDGCALQVFLQKSAWP